jgi:hypothetical protein
MNGVTNETVDKEIIDGWTNKKLNMAANKFYTTGIINQCFGLLSGV